MNQTILNTPFPFGFICKNNRLVALVFLLLIFSFGCKPEKLTPDNPKSYVGTWVFYGLYSDRYDAWHTWGGDTLEFNSNKTFHHKINTYRYSGHWALLPSDTGNVKRDLQLTYLGGCEKAHLAWDNCMTNFSVINIKSDSLLLSYSVQKNNDPLIDQFEKKYAVQYIKIK